jgi:hypothetical protein
LLALPSQEWVGRQRTAALQGLAELGKTAFTETVFGLIEGGRFSQFELLDAARESPIDTFGWPVGVFFAREEYRPRPLRDGIFARVLWGERETYDYWSLSLQGDFYLLKTLSEDALGHAEAVFYNTRIVRTTERFLYCRRLYNNLGITDDAFVQMSVRYSGIAGRVLGRAGGGASGLQGTAVETEMEHQEVFRLGEIDTRLVELVRSFCEPLFVLFDFFRVDDSVYGEIVTAFVGGEVR